MDFIVLIVSFVQGLINTKRGPMMKREEKIADNCTALTF